MYGERFTLSLAVYLLLFKDDQALLLRRFNASWSDGLYTLVSGHKDEDGSISAAMSREAKEEAGITIDPVHLEFAHVMHRKSDKEYIDFFFTTKKWEGEPYNAEPNKCDELKWFPIDKLPRKTIPYIKQVISEYQNGVNFSEVDFG